MKWLLHRFPARPYKVREVMVAAGGIVLERLSRILPQHKVEAQDRSDLLSVINAILEHLRTKMQYQHNSRANKSNNKPKSDTTRETAKISRNQVLTRETHLLDEYNTLILPYYVIMCQKLSIERSTTPNGRILAEICTKLLKKTSIAVRTTYSCQNLKNLTWLRWFGYFTRCKHLRLFPTTYLNPQ